MLNGSDSDSPLKVSNAGTGASIVATNGTTNTLNVSSTGSISIGATTQAACFSFFPNGTTTKYYIGIATGTASSPGYLIFATSTKPAGC